MMARPSGRCAWFVECFLLVMISIGVSIAFYVNHLDAKAQLGKNAFFQAEKTFEKEFKTQESLTFKKMDVDRKLTESIEKIKRIDSEFSKTRAAFEARLKLGSLYFDHGEFDKAIAWYKKALDSAPNTFEKSIVLSSLGYAYENSGKPAEALQAFQKALPLGERSLKGDLLLGVARNQEALHDLVKARSTYDQILTELPNTEYAKSAEIFKDQLQ